MQVSVFDVKGAEKGKIEVPERLLAPKRKDLVKKAFLAEKSETRQPYGTDPEAGQRSSAYYHGRRSKRNSMMNREMARMPRIINMGSLNFRARNVPQAVKGRKAHPPKAEKVWTLKINKKEWTSALFSAMSFTFDKNAVSLRGHDVSSLKKYPLVLDDSFQDMEKTKDVVDVLNSFGFEKELERCSEKKIRATKGKMRGRRYKEKKGPLIIVNEDKGLGKASKNIPGVDFRTAKKVDIISLAPGAHPGRLVIWTKSALESFNKTEKKESKTKPAKAEKKSK